MTHLHGLRCVAVAAVAVLLMDAEAAGDGVYIPEQAQEAMPEIPVQRALVVWRDGVETLVVESALRSDSFNVGWVLPLPAPPTRLEVADPGTLTSLAACQQPEITHDLDDQIDLLRWLLFLALPIAGILIATTRPRGATLPILLWVFVYLLFSCLLVPSLNSAALSGPVVGRLETLDTRRVGDYDVAVLRAGDAGALDAWLRENGLRTLDAGARSIVDDYIARGWCFVVARLARDKGGEAVPQPIAATFPVGAAVYPMKLTRLAGSTTRVELFVVADRQAEAEGFRTVVADTYRFMRQGHPVEFALDDEFTEAWYEARATDMAIGSPDVGALMWDGCALTRLSADLTPAAMDRDVELSFRDVRPRRDHVFSAQARWHVVTIIGLVGVLALAVGSAVVFYRRRRPTRRGPKVLAWVVVLTLSVAGAVYLTLPVVPVRTTPRIHRWLSQRHFGYLVADIRGMISTGELTNGMKPDEVLHAIGRSGWVEKVAHHESDSSESMAASNLFTGGEIRFERSPGNFSVREVEGKTFFCLYDQDGREIRIELKPPKPT